MANTFYNVLSDNKNQSWPVPASVAFSIGDLCYYDSSVNQVKPYTSKATLASEVLDQADVAYRTAGIAMDARLSTEADANALRLFLVAGVVDFPCLSSTFNIGDLVGPTWLGGAALVNQGVVKVSQPNLAIARVLQQYTVAVTTVRCFFVSRLAWDLFNSGQELGGQQGVGVTALADSAAAVTLAMGPILNCVPTAARTKTLPVEAQSAGVMFYFTNNSAGANAVTFQSSAAGAIKGNGVVPQNKTAVLWCDGTNWNGTVSA